MDLINRYLLEAVSFMACSANQFASAIIGRCAKIFK